MTSKEYQSMLDLAGSNQCTVIGGCHMGETAERIHPGVQDFLTYLEIERNASPGTVAGYRQDLEVFLRYLGRQMGVAPEDVDLGCVRRSHIRSFLAYLKNERSNSTRTINRKLCAIRSFYRFLTESEEWERDQDSCWDDVLEDQPEAAGVLDSGRDGAALGVSQTGEQLS